jgi:uncharacterized protein YqgV (UPF0045/DUF77 family)
MFLCLKQRYFISESCGILQEKKLTHEIHAMGTNVGIRDHFFKFIGLLEGSIKSIFDAVNEMRLRCHELGSDKVDIHVTISSRKEPVSLQIREKRVLESQSSIPKE